MIQHYINKTIKEVFDTANSINELMKCPEVKEFDEYQILRELLLAINKAKKDLSNIK